MKNSNPIEDIKQLLNPLRMKIASHPLYDTIKTQEDIQLFMRYHVFAVWDFMCLLKTLYARLVSIEVPWFPPKDALSAHLIGDIMQEEESDITEDGRYLSHYEMYLEAMEEIGADTQSIKQCINQLSDNNQKDWFKQNDIIPHAVKDFLQSTFDSFNEPTHALAASFVFGREDLTATMFKPLIQTIKSEKIRSANKLLCYLNRHIELDETDHATKAFTMLSNLCANDASRWSEVTQAAYRALTARDQFFTAIYEAILASRGLPPMDKPVTSDTISRVA